MADLRAMRADPGLFASEVLGRPVADWQAAEMGEAAVAGRLSSWLWARQMGKSTCFGLLGLWAAFRSPGRRVLVLSGGGDLGARRLLGEARRIAAGSPLLAGSVVDESGSILRLSTGSELRALSGLSENAVRGWSADVLLIDEAQLLPASMLSAALPVVLARPGAFIVLAGTAGRAEGDFYDLCRAGEVGGEGLRFSRRVSNLIAADGVPTPWLSATLLARLQDAMGPVRSAAELRCEWASGSDRLFSRVELERVTADYLPDELSGMRGPGAVWAGLDLGLSSDRSALVAVGRPVLPEGSPRVLAVRCAHAWAPRHPLMAPEGGAPGVFEEVAGSPAVFQSLRVDSTGMQAGFLQYLVPLMRRRDRALGGGRRMPRVLLVEEGEFPEPSRPRRPMVQRSGQSGVLPTSIKGVPFTAQMKQAAYAQLRALVQREQLLLPAATTELIRELLLLEVGLTARGSETFEAGQGGHDDLPDALVLSLVPYRARDGQWRTRAGDVVQLPDRARLVPPAGAWAAGETRTGSGLRVPVAPCWASPNGADLTVPEQVAEYRPPLDPELAERAQRIRVIVNQGGRHGA